MNNISPEVIAGIAGFLSSIITEFFPKFQELTSQQKRLVTSIVVLVIVAVVYTGSCTGLLSDGACDENMLNDLLWLIITAASGSQFTHSLNPTRKE